MPSPDPNAAAAWSRVIARLEGADEPEAPTTAAEPAEALPQWWIALANVPTVPTAPVARIATAPAATNTVPSPTAPPPPPAPAPAGAYIEPMGVTLFRQRCKRFATNPIASIFR